MVARAKNWQEGVRGASAVREGQQKDSCSSGINTGVNMETYIYDTIAFN